MCNTNHVQKILTDDNAVPISLIIKRKNIYWAIMEAEIYVTLPPKCIEFPKYSMVKIFWRNVSMSPLHWKTQATWENLFSNVPVIKLRMFGAYTSIIGVSIEAEAQVNSICTLFSDFSS